MWVFTKIGFFSVVEDRTANHRVMVRARNEEDLKRLLVYIKDECKRLPTIIQTPGADYIARLTVAKTVWSRVMSNLCLEIDYDNFKNTVPMDEPKRHTAYMQCWKAMNFYQSDVRTGLK